MLILMGKSQLYVTEKGPEKGLGLTSKHSDHPEKEPGLTSNHFLHTLQ